MFKKNDKALLTTRIIVMVVIGIFAVGSLIMGIVLAIKIHGALFLTAFAGWFLCWLMWVFARLYLSYLCDIKLIRNKLYGESNDNLEVFLKTREELSNRPAVSPANSPANRPVNSPANRPANRAAVRPVIIQTIESEMQRLGKLLKSGEITKEEYEKRKKTISQRLDNFLNNGEITKEEYEISKEALNK